MSLRKETARESSLVLAEKETDFIRVQRVKRANVKRSRHTNEENRRSLVNKWREKRDLESRSETAVWRSTDPKFRIRMSLKIGCESVSRFNDPIIIRKSYCIRAVRRTSFL